MVFELAIKQPQEHLVYHGMLKLFKCDQTCLEANFPLAYFCELQDKDMSEFRIVQGHRVLNLSISSMLVSLCTAKEGFSRFTPGSFTKLCV